MGKKRKRNSRKFTIPIAPIVGLLPMVSAAATHALKGDFDRAMNELKWNTLGIQVDGKFNAVKFGQNMMPLVLGLLVHKFVGGAPLNLNRMLAAANVPIIRI
ncbi:hypothetical protein ES705_27032 [subsurface metagenome]